MRHRDRHRDTQAAPVTILTQATDPALLALPLACEFQEQDIQAAAVTTVVELRRGRFELQVELLGEVERHLVDRHRDTQAAAVPCKLARRPSSTHPPELCRLIGSYYRDRLLRIM